jgi:hypothetical protein
MSHLHQRVDPFRGGQSLEFTEGIGPKQARNALRDKPGLAANIRRKSSNVDEL